MPDFSAHPDASSAPLSGDLLPEWLESRALDDSVFEHAYESLGAESRARLKHGIAVLHAWWGEEAVSRRESREFRQGFRVDLEETPAPYLLLVCAADWALPELLPAVLLPAVSAGRPVILPCFVPAQSDPSPALPAALELTGVEDAFCLDPEEAVRLFEHLSDKAGRGRVVVLGKGTWADELVLRAARHGTPCRMISGDAADFEAEAALGHIRILPDLPPAWFRNRRLRLSALEEN